MAFAANCANATAHQPPPSLVVRGNPPFPPIQTQIGWHTPAFVGCYNDSGTLKLNTTRMNTQQTINFGNGPELDTGVSSGNCEKWCGAVKDKNDQQIYQVAAMSQGTQCWCGTQYPPKSSLTDTQDCDIPCSGYDLEYCGGSETWSVYNLGFPGVTNSKPKVSSTSAAPSSTSAAKTSSISSAVSEPTVTTIESILPDDSKKGKSNTAGIVAGTVVAVVVVLSAVGGVFLFMRRKRNKEIEDEHRRNAAVNAFVGKPPSTSDGMSMADARLDPVLVQRRLSDGSIADNQDYSRRILRVTNA